MGVKEIKDKKKLIAIIVYKEFKKKGIYFFTPNNFPQQLGYMNRPKNYVIKPHKHRKIVRKIDKVQEVLFIKKGKLQVDLYNPSGKFISKYILKTGDCIFLSSGGHGFRMLSNTEILEVKLGPYLGIKEKKYF
jgi:hypothetical protein